MDSDEARRALAGETFRRTADSVEFEIQPTDAGQLRLLPVDASDEDSLVVDPATFVLRAERGDYYIAGNVGRVLRAARVLP